MRFRRTWTDVSGGGTVIGLVRELAFRHSGAFAHGFRPVAIVVHSRAEWKREVALRASLAAFPCAVIAFHLREVLGRTPSAWVVPLAMAFANALLAVSIAREALRRRGFLLFWALFALAWTAVAWHGVHFHRPPRPAALLMNLDEIAHTPMPDWSEIPWAVAVAALAFGWLARRASPAGRDLRLATLAAALLCAGLHAGAFLRYRTFEMVRFSEYRDLVRTRGLEGAVVLDGLDIVFGPDGESVLGDLRLDAVTNPPRTLPLDPSAVDRLVIVQLESLDVDAVSRAATPAIARLWEGATRGLLDSLRTSVSGSSSADFQLLTGLRPRTSVPVYRLTWDRHGSALPAHAASRGFSFHAFHGNDRHFWNRGTFFGALGMDFHTAESMPETEFSRWGRADGDLFRYAAARIRPQERAVYFLITLSTHAPYDLVDPAAHLDGAPVKTRYLESVAYLDHALEKFLRSLPREGRTLVAIYSDHTSGVFDSGAAEDERPVPMMLGMLAPDGSLSPLAREGKPVRQLAGTWEIPSLHRFLKDCLDASAP